MFESRKELTERLAALTSDLEAAETSVAELTANLEEARAEASQAVQDLEAARKDAADSADLLKETADRLEAAEAKLDTFDEEVENAATAKSTQELDAMGHAPVALEPTADDAAEPLAAQVNYAEALAKIDDPAEAYSFAKDNREAVLAALFPRK